MDRLAKGTNITVAQAAGVIMGVGISYMGTKRELAPLVSEVVAACQPGPLLDVFSGMCSVAEAVASTRQVWTNDIQVFAFQVALALFTSQQHPMASQAIADQYYDSFQHSFSNLSLQYDDALKIEDEALIASNFNDFEDKRRSLSFALSQCHRDIGHRKYHLFTRMYSDTFIGLRQSIEIDSIIHAVNTFSGAGKSHENIRWLLIALGRSMLRVSNSTGHFAQFLTPKAESYRTFQRQRKRRIWTEWLDSNDELNPVGDPSWRRNNKAFNEDALVLLPRLNSAGDKPSVIYADPPYTSDQYSRYYHLLETLVLYDYPEVAGKGLYRPNRFSTRFSQKAKSASAMESLIKFSSQLGSDIVLSYPSNGLARDAGVDPLEILKRYYNDVEVCNAIECSHSTLGASKGAARSSVVEMLYKGRL